MSFDVMEERTPCDYCGQPVGFLDDDWAVCPTCRTEYINMDFEGGDLDSQSPLEYWFIHFDRKVKTMSPFVYFMWIVWICILAVIAFVLFIPILIFSLLAVPILLIGILILWPWLLAISAYRPEVGLLRIVNFFDWQVLGELRHHVVVDSRCEGLKLFFCHLADFFGHLVIVALCQTGDPFDNGWVFVERPPKVLCTFVHHIPSREAPRPGWLGCRTHSRVTLDIDFSIH